MLEPCKICFHTIMANYDVIAILASLDTIWWLNVALSTYYPNLASSGHIRGCRDADIQPKSLSSGIYPSILS
eukprot:scaffold30891_cov96-Skeletonema_marinoi.AAC.3